MSISIPISIDFNKEILNPNLNNNCLVMEGNKQWTNGKR
nr:MAG TPA: hypothetical protein [Siphoviridae sp. ctRJB2]